VTSQVITGCLSPHVASSNEVLWNKIWSTSFQHSDNFRWSAQTACFPVGQIISTTDYGSVRLSQGQATVPSIQPSNIHTGSRAQRCHFSPIRFKVLQHTTKQFRPFVNGQQRCKWETIFHNSYTYRQSCPCTGHECISGEGVDVYLQPFLTSELDGSERSA
jgi:hypothetical protein